MANKHRTKTRRLKTLLIVIVVVSAFLSVPSNLSAQRRHGFAVVGTQSDLNNDSYPSFGGGYLLDLLHSWTSVGVQGDLFLSNGYMSGRFGPVGQLNVIRHGTIRPFLIGGIGWGEDDGPMFGAGIEIRPQSRLGFRASVEDYRSKVGGLDCARFGYTQAECDARPHGGRPYTANQMSIQFGISLSPRR